MAKKTKGKAKDQDTNENTMFVHVTDVVKGASGCPRQLELRLRGEKRTPQKRWATIRGSIFHKIMEVYYKNGTFTGTSVGDILREFDDLVPANIPKAEVDVEVAHILEMAMAEMENLGDLSGAELIVEQTMYLPMGDYNDISIIMTGTPDLIIRDMVKGTTSLVDFKTGKRHMKSHDLQVAMYRFMAEHQEEKNPIDIDALELHYLGDLDKKGVNVTPVPYEEGACSDAISTYVGDITTMLDNIESSPDALTSPCKEGFFCLYCGYGDRCIGL